MKLLLAISLALLIPTSSFAGEMMTYDLTAKEDNPLKGKYPPYYKSLGLIDFAYLKGTPLEGLVSTWLNKDEQKNDFDKFNVKIANSKIHTQELYFSQPSTCNPDTAKTEITFLKINNQNVKMLGICSSGGRYKYVAATPKGIDFVINEFKTKNVVFVGFTKVWNNIPFATNGFTEVWDNFGGDAI